MPDAREVLIAAALPMPMDGIANLNSLVENMYGTGAMIDTAQPGYIRITEPSEGLGPTVRKWKKQKDFGDTGILRQIAFSEGGVDMTVEEAQDVILRLAQAFGTWFDAGRAENYVTCNFIDHDDADTEFHLTLQKTSKPTAHTLRAKAEARVAELEQTVAELELRIREAGGDI